jgi:hypothetical protein
VKRKIFTRRAVPLIGADGNTYCTNSMQYLGDYYAEITSIAFFPHNAARLKIITLRCASIIPDC